MNESSARPLDWVDEGSFVQADEPSKRRDPLSYPGYPEALEKARARSGSDESVKTGKATVEGRDCEVALFEFGFFGGSMGEETGERLARAMERATERGVPFVLVTATGGARMQEGMRSLIQMAKVVSARLALGEAGVPFVAVMSHPTTGGVLASLAALADITVAVEKATIGFAGPRLVERQTGRPLGENSHTAGSALAAGLVDEVVPESGVRQHLGRILSVLAPAGGDRPSSPVPPSGEGTDPGGAWDAVLRARDPNRPSAVSLARAVLEPAIELRGDRAGMDDPAVRALLGRHEDRALLILALDRSHRPGPHAYRKAVRAVHVASRLATPVVTLVDTPGADASEESEAGGVAWAIAELFAAMLSAPVPIVSILTGEGGSGGALAFACADALIAYDDAVFSVIGPELAAEILYRDPGRAQDTAEALRLTARDLLELKIADSLAPGPPDPESLSRLLAYHLARPQESEPAARRKRWRSR